MAGEPILRVENMSKKFKAKTVLEEVSFDVMRGEFLSLLGPSGCGKTTILRMLIGIEKPTGGSILKDGKDITDAAPKDRNIGIVFQNYSLFPNMDVYHNISYALASRKTEKEEIHRKVREIIETVGLEEHIYKKPKQLSHDQEEAFALSDRIMVINDMKIAQLDTPRQIYHHPADAFVKRFIVDHLDMKVKSIEDSIQ